VPQQILTRLTFSKELITSPQRDSTIPDKSLQVLAERYPVPWNLAPEKSPYKVKMTKTA